MRVQISVAALCFLLIGAMALGAATAYRLCAA